MTLDEWNDVVNELRRELANVRTESLELVGKLGQCHAMLLRIGYGSEMPGGRPLAGGVQVDARELLKDHGVVVGEAFNGEE